MSGTCLVVGSGISGLAAGSALAKGGWRVQVVDKGSVVGGRLATRRGGNVWFDHGAQFFTARDPRFAAMTQEWVRTGVVRPWFEQDGIIRYCGASGINAIALQMAEGLEVRCGSRLTGLDPLQSGWRARLESGDAVEADAVVLTAPVPQSLELCSAFAGRLPEQLSRIEYQPCVTLLVKLDRASNVPSPGYVVPEEGPISWVADNTQKALQSGPAALTIQARPGFSREVWDSSDASITCALLEAAAPWLSGAVIEQQLHRWKYSQPVTVAAERCLYVPDPGPIVFAGDAFGGPRVEGAFLSGLAAAEQIARV